MITKDKVMTQEETNKFCEHCQKKNDCGFLSRDLQDKCPDYQNYSDGYEQGYKRALDNAVEWWYDNFIYTDDVDDKCKNINEFINYMENTLYS